MARHVTYECDWCGVLFEDEGMLCFQAGYEICDDCDSALDAARYQAIDNTMEQRKALRTSGESHHAQG